MMKYSVLMLAFFWTTTMFGAHCRYSKKRSETTSAIVQEAASCGNDGYCFATLVCDEGNAVGGTVEDVVCMAQKYQGSWACPEADACRAESAKNARAANFTKTDATGIDWSVKSPTTSSPGEAR